MPNVLIRDLPEETILALDTQAARLGLSRNEYLRRRLGQESRHGAGPVTVGDLQRFADRFVDLSDPDVMAQAWS